MYNYIHYIPLHPLNSPMYYLFISIGVYIQA